MSSNNGTKAAVTPPSSTLPFIIKSDEPHSSNSNGVICENGSRKRERSSCSSSFSESTEKQLSTIGKSQQSSSRSNDETTNDDNSNRENTFEITSISDKTNSNDTQEEYSNESNKKQKRQVLHVEAILHPSCPHPPSSLQREVENYIQRLCQHEFVFKEGPISFQNVVTTTTTTTTTTTNNHHQRENASSNSNGNDDHGPTPPPVVISASLLIQQSLLQINIVDIEHDDNNNNFLMDHELHQISSSHDNNNNNHLTNNPQPNIINTNKSIPSQDISQIQVYTYILHSTTPEPEELDIDDGNTNGDAPIIAYEITSLPNLHLATSWESLIIPPPIKSNLIGYATSALYFTLAGIDCHVISWNRIILLHGPPGTGKTSLCRALAHKLSIRCTNTFTQGGYLLEIKSHSLFSKWFSESGKLISKLFERIQEMVEEEPHALFCVLLDEVESLAANRVGSSGGGGSEHSEPSDSVRAVNSLLTSLDRLKQYKNLIIFTTTNITHGVDSAFVDRVDMKQYIGLPCLEARFEILKSCLEELIRVGIVVAPEDLDEDRQSSHGKSGSNGKVVALKDSTSNSQSVSTNNNYQPYLQQNLASVIYSVSSSDIEKSTSIKTQVEQKLFECAKATDGLSGRTLRKLPFQTHAWFVKSREPVSLLMFLGAMMECIVREKKSVEDLKQKVTKT